MEGYLGMPDNRRAPVFAYVLAVPVFIAVYAGAFGTRVWAALRPVVATFLGATVIGTVYADYALKKAPATPMRAAAVLALAVALVGPGMAPAPAFAGGDDPAAAVIAAAREYIGKDYRLGAEGPKEFDCSGLIYRAFADAGELPRVGGMRLLARGYLRWFQSRGLFTKDESKADPGDLVVWNDGEHIGIYLGNGRALSALVNPYGVMTHSLNGIHQKVTQFLKVNWRNGDDDNGNGNGDGDDNDNGNGNGNGDGDNNGNGDGNGGPGPGDNQSGAQPTEPPQEPDPTAEPTAEPTPDPTPDAGEPTDPGDGGPVDGPHEVIGDNAGSSDNAVRGNTQEYGPPAPNAPDPGTPNNPPSEPTDNGQAVGNGFAAGTLNLRQDPTSTARIVGWVSRGTHFKILDKHTSDSGWLWYRIQTASGRQGWLFGYWVRES
jgi:hypothetical protein